jgi:ubiquinone/menaquinone biosynthesis C-methylase UbiE
MSDNPKIEKPVELWRHHAQHRRNSLAVIRAWLSMAGFRDWTMLRHIPKGSKILDVGCGGGRPILAERGTVTGLEPIAELAQVARGVYSRVVEGDARALPFRDGEFDVLVTTDVIGHVPNESKAQIFGEFARVLRKGGLTIHIAEIESDGWLARIAKREAEVYQRVWVEAPDHRNLETADRLLARFTAAGFQILEAQPIQAYLPECGQLYGLMYRHQRLSLWLKTLVRLDYVLSRQTVIKELTSLLMTPLGMINRLASPGQGLGLIVVARKV